MSQSNLQSILEDIIAIRSDVSTDRTEAALTQYILDFFKPLKGWTVTTQEVAKDRRNIIATTSDAPDVVFVSHQDTVPVTQKEQLKPKVVDGKLYGRGAIDMKAGVAMMLYAAQQQAWKNTAMIFTVDEEYHFAGIEKFVAQSPNWQPKIIINPEPTDLGILAQCRGLTELELEVWGKAAHAGQKMQGVNAIEKTVELCQKLEQRLKKLDKSSMQTSLNLAAIEGGVLSEHKLTVRPNVVPDFARVTIEIRIGSTQLTQDKLEFMTYEVARSLGIEIDQYKLHLWYGAMPGAVDEIQGFLDVMEDHNLETDLMNPNDSGFFEVQLLQEKWNCPVAVFGPGPLAKSHQDDEYVYLDQLETAAAVLLAYLNKHA